MSDTNNEQQQAAAAAAAGAGAAAGLGLTANDILNRLQRARVRDDGSCWLWAVLAGCTNVDPVRVAAAGALLNILSHGDAAAVSSAFDTFGEILFGGFSNGRLSISRSSRHQHHFISTEIESTPVPGFFPRLLPPPEIGNFRRTLL